MSRNRTYDLNVPSEAREWLNMWVEEGYLTFQTHETVESLSDARVVQLAKDIFLKADYYHTGGAVQ